MLAKIKRIWDNMRLSYSVKNLRRLTSTPPIEIRPITILLGRNSVGKSTFLRSFPLLRQSVETKSSAPNYGLVITLILEISKVL